MPLASLIVVVTDPSALVTVVVTSALELLDEPSALLDVDAPDFDAPDLAVALNVLIGVVAAPTLARLVMMVSLQLDTILAGCCPQAMCQIAWCREEDQHARRQLSEQESK